MIILLSRVGFVFGSGGCRWTCLPGRGVQYVHWVMHKCIMVKVGWKRNTHKVCIKQVNLKCTETENRGNSKFFENRGKSETGGKCIMASGG